MEPEVGPPSQRITHYPPVEPEAGPPSQRTSHKTSCQRAKSSDPDISNDQIKKAAALCSVEPEVVGNFQLRKALKPLLDLEKIDKKKTCYPINFRGTSIVTTFVRSAGDRTRGVWKFLEMVC